MVQLTSLALAFAASFTGAQAGTCAACNPASIIQDGSFEDASSTAWTFDSGVTVESNAPGADYAVTGNNYVSFDVSDREDYERYGITQQLAGVKPNTRYTLQYTYDLTDASGIYDGGVDATVTLDGVQVDYVSLVGQDSQGIATPRSVTVTPTSASPVLYISWGGSGDYYYGATIAMDDISMELLCQ
ncbi:hypothetical protein SCUCBS95973_004750 [Sporothrix curviconia]|uniref:CBM-cenC domain-containing protein n=1 Tax=Sporothrix curviconia TaxID=1260050 RepID=A0ABP0BSX0_9PEZI